MHCQLSLCRPRPFIFRPVPIKLYAIIIGIAQIQRFAHPMIARSVERDAMGHEAFQCIGKIGTRWIENGQMIKTCGS